jgi:hypothetical protein
MAVIKRGLGRSATEKKLAALADKLFLNLWTYPNLYTKDGKELCDVLVVCGGDVLIFSDKDITWQKHRDFEIAWSRWYRGAIEESVAQIRGAERYLREHPDELYLDAACTQKFPLVLPPLERRRIHRIAIALGAAEACAEHHKASLGYFPICPDLKGASHIQTAADDFVRFAIGDVNPEGDFVHVFNEPALELLARELDTVTDFVRYLTRRERIMRSGRLLTLNGEHDLLGHYLTSGGPDDEHDFALPGDGEGKKVEKLLIPSGTFAGLAQHPGYKARKKADEISYTWDNLLTLFTTSIIEGEAECTSGEEPTAAEAEVGLRSMALELRLRRRLLGAFVADAMKTAEANKHDHFARQMLPGKHSADGAVAYTFLVLAHHGEAPGDAYSEYRERRRAMLKGYALNMLKDHRALRRAVGIGIDASPKVTGRVGGSEDFYAVEVDTWTPEIERQANELKELLGLLKPENMTSGHAAVDEFPRTIEKAGRAHELIIKDGRAVAAIVPDAHWPNMWRVRLANGHVSDMVNLTRARDAARPLGRRVVSEKDGYRE